jgi:molybdenum cofactor cytidylyltransferase
MSAAIQTILLAAGYASRHPDKLEHPVQGSPALIHVISTLREADLEPIVVLGHQADKCKALLRKHLTHLPQIVVNERYAEGMASSIVAGITACDSQPDAYSIHLADKPFVQVETLRMLADEWAALRPAVLQPVYEGSPGHPVIFRYDMKQNLLELTGDSGAKQLLIQLANEVKQVDVNDDGVTLDLDAYLEQTID